MKIGIPKEIKIDEFRVGATPHNVSQLINDNHTVFVQSGAGNGSGFSDEQYRDFGAKIVENIEILYAKATLIVKVKEPQIPEYDLLNEKHTLFCYLHLAPLKELSLVLLQKGVCAIAYETVESDGMLPLLKPMSEIAGKMAPVIGAYHLSRYQGGDGVLIGGADGVEPANVLVIGAGNAGFNAAKIATGLGANVRVINRSSPKLESLKEVFPSVKTDLYSLDLLRELLKDSDVVISTVLIHGGDKTPKLITKDMLHEMKDGSIIVDITIDQGGISQSSTPTTHTNPIFVDDGVLHYCVANMPGAYPKTATLALTNATMPYIKKLVNKGIINAIKNDKSLARGVNIYKGNVTNKAIAKAHEFEFRALTEIL